MSSTAVDVRHAAPERVSRRSAWALWCRWTVAMALGELAGFGLAMSLGGLIFMALGQEASGLAFSLLGLPAATLAGIVEGSIVAWAQWLVLRRYLWRAGWWIAANALAWIVGLTVGIGGPSLLADWSNIAAIVAMGTLTGLLMGGLVGAITGLAVVWLLRDRLPR